MTNKEKEAIEIVASLNNLVLDLLLKARSAKECEKKDKELEYQRETKKKDKIIDEMAEYIASKQLFVDKELNVLPKEIIKEYFEKNVLKK